MNEFEKARGQVDQSGIATDLQSQGVQHDASQPDPSAPGPAPARQAEHVNSSPPGLDEQFQHDARDIKDPYPNASEPPGKNAFENARDQVDRSGVAQDLQSQGVQHDPEGLRR